MNSHVKRVVLMIPAGIFLWLVHSCQDPMYDLNKGIDTEIKVGGDSLTIPLGSTDTIKLKDFLSTNDLEFLEIREDGGYGLKIADSLYVNDILKDLDKSKLKFEDYLFSENTTVSFGDINLGDFKIPGINMKDSVLLKIPKVDIGDISPAVNLNKQFTMGFSDYALSEDLINIPNMDGNQASFENFLAGVLPYNIPVHPSGSFSITQPIVIEDANGQPLKVNINYSIEVPDGVTQINQIDLDGGGTLEVSLKMTDAASSLSAGNFVPDISIDPSNLFDFSPMPNALVNGKIVLNQSSSLTNFNNYETTKEYTITTFKNLPAAVSNFINISKQFVVTGSLSGNATLMENKSQQAKEIDLEIDVVVKNMKVKNMNFQLPDFNTTISGASVFTIAETGLPEQVNKINKIYLEKTAGSALPTNMVIQFVPSNLPVITNANYKIDQLDITFPLGFAFSNMAGRTYSVSNIDFNTTTGYKVELNLSEVDLSATDITEGGVLNWSGNIEYNGQISVQGTMNSEDISSTSDPVINLTSQTAIRLASASVVTNAINETLETNTIALNMEIDIAKEVARLTTINMKRGGMIRLNLNIPALPLNLTANNIAIQFSDMFEFYPTTGLDQNKFTINGVIPPFIELELKALHINKDLIDGKLTLNENISISGGVILESGTVNSAEIADLSAKKLITEAIVSDLFIESTSIEMKTLEASYNDVTAVEMEINDIPAEIVALDSIILKSGSSIALDITLTNLPNLGDNPLTANIKVKFPQLLVFGPNQVNESNELIINEPIVDGKLSKNIQLRGLRFGGEELGGKLSINDNISYEVAVRVENPTINSEELTDEPIDVAVKVTLKGLEFQKVYGTFDLNIDDELSIDNIAFDLPDILKGDDMVLDIANPVLTLTTESNIGIPVDAQLGLTKFKNGQLLTNDKIAINFRLPKSESPSETKVTNYWIAPSEAGKPTGYTYLPTELQDLLKPIPDSVKIEIKPTVDTQVQHLIDLLAIYNLKVKYDINIPFSFGKDLSISLKDTIDNIDLGLEENQLKTGSLELLGSISNSIPLNLELQLLLTDANFNILATTDKQTIQAGAPDGSGVVSQISIKLADNLEDLSRLNKVILSFKATSNATVAGTPIKPDNYIKAELKARIEGGIKVKL